MQDLKGAHLRDVLEEEYVMRNTTQTQREELLTNPRLVRKDREGLEEHFDSEEPSPEQYSAAAERSSRPQGDRPDTSFPKPP